MLQSSPEQKVLLRNTKQPLWDMAQARKQACTSQPEKDSGKIAQSQSRTWCITNNPPRGKKPTFLSEHTCAMCKPSHIEQTEAGSFGMSCNALGHGGGGSQTIPLVKQWLQNSQNVWNPGAAHFFRLPKQIRSSLCVHMWKTGVLQQLLPESVNMLPFFQCAFLPFSCTQFYLDYITFYSILSFKLIAERETRWKNSSADQT